ncbi:MAG: ABC transporter permease [Candidatus Methylacidiphilales bacterium]
MNASILRIQTLAHNTLLESLRQKVLLVLILFGLVLTGASFYFTDFTFTEEFKFLKDIGSAAIDITGILVAMIGAAQMIPAEIEKRTIYTVLSKPVRRVEFLLGKYFGLLALLTLMLAIMSVLFFGVLWIKHFIEIQEIVSQNAGNIEASEYVRKMIAEVRAQVFDDGLLQALLLTWMKLALVAALAVFFSTLASSTEFIVFSTLVVYFIGHLQATARQAWIGMESGSWWEKLLLFLVSWLIPDFQSYSIIDELLAGNAVTWMYVGEITLYSFFYTVVVLVLGAMVFQEREL